MFEDGGGKEPNETRMGVRTGGQAARKPQNGWVDPVNSCMGETTAMQTRKNLQ